MRLRRDLLLHDLLPRDLLHDLLLLLVLLLRGLLLNVDQQFLLFALLLSILLDFLLDILLVETKLLDDSINKVGGECVVVGTEFIRSFFLLLFVLVLANLRISLVDRIKGCGQIDDGVSQRALRFDQFRGVDVLVVGPRDGVFSELVDALLKK